MVNRPYLRVLLLAAVVLTTAAVLRGAEYDEQYTLFLTAGTARPNWPSRAFLAGTVADIQAGHATFGGIARDLRATDVHPPLYFWTVWLWRFLFGPSLLAARSLSIICGILSVGIVGGIARHCGIRPAAAMLLTLGSYGFVYTNIIARGFAQAELLTLAGFWLLLARRPGIAGLCLGAACCSNYLAVFVGGAVVLLTGAWATAWGAMPFLALDLWFFAAQHAARIGQFPPFRLLPSLARLAKYQAAALFGGLPLYVDGPARIAVGAGVAIICLAWLLMILRARPWSANGPIRMVLAASVATPMGLLLLGFIFDNTPIELRYLSFSIPFVALLAARYLPSRLIGGTLIVQSVAIAGLMLSPRTMQPARDAARQAASISPNTVVFVPEGNDGVGIVGAFGIEAAPALKMEVIRNSEPLAARLSPYERVAVARMSQDHDSTAELAKLDAALARGNWHRVAIGSTLEVFERAGGN